MYRHNGRHMWWGILGKSSVHGLMVRSLGRCPHFISGLRCQKNYANAQPTSTPLLGRASYVTSVLTAPIKYSKVMKEDKREKTWLPINLWNAGTFRLGFPCLQLRTARRLGFQSQIWLSWNLHLPRAAKGGRENEDGVWGGGYTCSPPVTVDSKVHKGAVPDSTIAAISQCRLPALTPPPLPLLEPTGSEPKFVEIPAS